MRYIKSNLQSPCACCFGLRLSGIIYEKCHVEVLRVSSAKVIFVVDNFAQALEQVIEETNIKRIVLSKMGDMMGLKGILVNTIIRQVKRLVPKYNLTTLSMMSPNSLMCLKKVETCPSKSQNYL